MTPFQLPPAIMQLAAAARELRTPCGSGHLVWRQWDGAGPPVLLLHGGSGSWTHWLRNIPALRAAGRTVLAPDLPGFGDSATPPGGEDADAVVVPLAAGLRTLAPAAVDLVGFSFGSLVASLLAAAAGPAVRRLVLVGAPVLPLASGRGVALESWRHLAVAAEQAAVHARNLRSIMLHRANSIDAATVALHAFNVQRDRMRARRLVTTSLLADTLATLQCPVHAVYGAEDVLYRGCWPEVQARLATLPAVRDVTLLPGAGHWVQYEEPEAFNRRLLAALAA